MKTQPHYLPSFFLIAILTGCGLIFVSAYSLRAQTSESSPPATTADPASIVPPDNATGDPSLSQQISQLQAKNAQLEAALAKSAPKMAAAPASTSMPAMPSADPAVPPVTTDPVAPQGEEMNMTNMMAMMDKMMGMMDKMMSKSESGSMPSGTGAMGMDKMMAKGESGPMPSGNGAMGMDKMGMGGKGEDAMPAAAAGMNGGAMGADKMQMSEMMGMSPMNSGVSGAMPQSALPGFPGASHLYHIGSTGFFLDHAQNISLTIEQQAGLNKAKEQALLAKSTADRDVEQAEQTLWTLTSADQPDAIKVEAKLREIEKLRSDERLAFIHAVGDASKLLTDDQRKILTGFAPPVPMNPMPATTPGTAPAMTGGPMKDM